METRWIKTADPRNESIIVKLELPDTVHGIAIPEEWQGQKGKVKVVAVADGVKSCKPGDYVILSGNARVADLDPFDNSVRIVQHGDSAVVAVVTYVEDSIIIPATGSIQ